MSKLNGTSPQHRSILLVEDDPVARTAAQGLLARWGYRVTVAASGREALNLLEKADFDAVVMDVAMSEVGGLEATERIREREQREQSRRLPIVALTGSVMQRDQQKCLAAGMDAYVAKPVSPALRRVLEGLLAQSFSSSMGG